MLIFKRLCFLLSLISASIFAQQPTEKFSQLNDFGSNPGELSASYFTSTKASKLLVVLLHGCSQNGEQLAKQSGFLGLAKKHQFNLLIPQQSKNNNIQSCFNWFSPQDQQRNQGETLSLKQMVDTLKTRTQATQVYIAGLSAGGAMASAMLVNYPNLFNAGAIISGIAYPCADNLTKAISCMRNGPSQTIKQLVQQSLTQNSEQKTWPRLSVWTGDKDNVVAPINALRIAQQWASLSGIGTKPKKFKHDGYQQKQWRNSTGELLVELFQVTDMGHGIAINDSIENGSEATPFLLKAPLSAANEIVKFWFEN
ncbi:PHB depolymerase family esterase [Thalassotalea psychrophila]|uniref:PHB depolymerase family esterase n=1 Tax=Thalassotalea psychrophila TaxID=3065647 RepID=A0ABY9TUK5_9GAMM|nr:PHB depolymerase family esterase [Colwelliaceae bacterium SQ149]